MLLGQPFLRNPSCGILKIKLCHDLTAALPVTFHVMSPRFPSRRIIPATQSRADSPEAPRMDNRNSGTSRPCVWVLVRLKIVAMRPATAPLLEAPVPAVRKMGAYQVCRADAFEWLAQTKPLSIHAVVTDPPYGLVEYKPDQLEKMKNGRGGVWRIPPSFDGCQRSPLPRFTVLTASDKEELRSFFARFAALLMPVVVPGAHVFIATNPLISYLVYEPFIKAGFEKRGEIIRVVYTLRGGDRPKNAHDEFPDISVMPKSCWEPWGLFRKPCEGRVQDNLRKWGTGGLRRISNDEPFKDLIYSSPARDKERAIAPHPSLKPQHFLRQMVRAALPLGKGVILDPFMGSGSTIAAAAACGLTSIGLELNAEYFRMAGKAIPALAALTPKEPTRNGTKH
jgi:site-specific DNA-methyltransferase (adenine-specific)